MFKRDDYILMQVHPYNTTALDDSLLKFEVSKEVIGNKKGLKYKIVSVDKDVSVIQYQFYEIDRTRTEQAGTVIGTTAKYIEPSVSTAAVADGFIGLDTAGSLFTFTSTMNLIAKFRFVDVYFGEVLEPFLASVGDTFQAAPLISKNTILQNQVGSRAKLTVYETSISTLDTYYFKFGIYFFSYILRLFTKRILQQLQKMKRVNKFVIYGTHYQNIFHFIFMNMFISNGVFLTTRTLLHVRNWAPSFFLNFDRSICLLVFYCYWSDLIELLTTSMYVEYRSEELSPESL